MNVGKKAFIVGASSGIGEALARLLAKEGYTVALAARRKTLLDALANQIPNSVPVELDVTRIDEAVRCFQDIIHSWKGVDLVVISAGTGFINPTLEWEKEKATIDVNVTGFCSIANTAMEHFVRSGSGHLVVLSSVGGLIGSPLAPAYSASKAFVSNYIEGLQGRIRSLHLPVTVTDVRAGFVDTAMAQGPGIFWMATPAEAARQIFRAIVQKKRCVYVTRRWRLIAWFFKIAPRRYFPR
jgi:short-subunit dehydrogenase